MGSIFMFPRIKRGFHTCLSHGGSVVGDAGAPAGPGKGSVAESTEGIAHIGLTPWKASSRGSSHPSAECRLPPPPM